MGGLSIWHLLILGAVVLIVFGSRGKISDIMGDVAKGIKSFKKGLADDEPAATPPQALDHRPGVETGKVSDTQKAG
jgi:sec-independent protein translocase protein TatA